MTSDTPITVKEHTLPEPVSAALRYLIAIGLPMAIQRGYLPADSTEGVTAMIITAATVGYGLWRTYQQRKKLVAVAEAAPDTIAVVIRKGEEDRKPPPSPPDDLEAIPAG